MKKQKVALGRLSMIKETVIALNNKQGKKVAGGASNDHAGASCGCSGPHATQGAGTCVATWCGNCVTQWC